MDADLRDSSRGWGKDAIVDDVGSRRERGWMAKVAAGEWHCAIEQPDAKNAHLISAPRGREGNRDCVHWNWCARLPGKTTSLKRAEVHPMPDASEAWLEQGVTN